MSVIVFPANPSPVSRLWFWIALSLLAHIAGIVFWHALPKTASEADTGDAITLALRVDTARAMALSAPPVEGPSSESEIQAAPAEESFAAPVESSPPPRQPKVGATQPMSKPKPVAVNKSPPPIQPKPRQRVATSTAPIAATSANNRPLPAPSGSAERRSDPGESGMPGPALGPRLAELLRRAIEEQKRYPFTSRRRGQQGTATVAFTLTPTGLIQDAEVDQSSGYAPLDRAALDAVQGIEPFQAASDFLTRPEQFRLDIAFRLSQR